jgi:lysophospholipase L1-like esterase
MHHPVARSGRRIRAAAGALTTMSLLAATTFTAGAHARTTPRPAPRPAPAPVTPSTPVTPGSGYLALGDSVTFGYMEPTVVPAPDYSDAASFTAYPQILGAQLHLTVANAACPGETSTSLLNASAPSNGCENTPAGSTTPGYRSAYPLHVRYGGSQMTFANTYLTHHPGTRLVSLMIGANDGFLCQETTADHCASELGTVLGTVTRNVHTILATIRGRDHYRGQIVIVEYYSLDYASALDNGESQAINSAVRTGAEKMHVRFADAYTSFANASAHSGSDTCTAGLLTQLGSPTTCGVHPSVAGQTLLASTVARAIRIR